MAEVKAVAWIQPRECVGASSPLAQGHQGGTYMIPLYAESALSALRDEVERLARTEIACREWIEKTEWVQNTIKPKELGMHRADVMRLRIEQAKSRAARLEADNARLREVMAEAIDSIEGCESGHATRELRAALAEKEGGL